MGVKGQKSNDNGVTQFRLAAIVESSNDAIIAEDLNGIVTDWNKGAERLFGYAHAEMAGHTRKKLTPPDRQAEEDAVMDRVRRGETVQSFETIRQSKEGRLIHVSVTVSAIKDRDGSIIGISKIARDITRQKKFEDELAHLNRLYSALSHVNQSIAWTSTREELFQRVCRILVEQGGFKMAWIGWHDSQTRRIVPAAEFGDESEYVRTVSIYGDDRPEGRGPTGIAFRTGAPYICNDMHHNPITLPWRLQLVRRGFQASAGFPIRVKDAVGGVLTVYSDDPWFFKDKEIALLSETARDISFALDNFAEKAARREVELAAENERLFSSTMIESMPGILYFYDESGKFLRWNRNFEIVSGYTREEIAGMRPHDFFLDQDQAALSQRIAEVFAQGESSIEASFVAKDGTATPYFFTGRRVMFEGKRCLVGMGVDISERKRAEQRLAESERKYRELVQHANSIILRWDCDGQIKFLNEFGQRFFGYTAEEILGRNVMGTIVPGTESSGRNLRQLIEQICADPKSFELNTNENVRRNGERVWISWTNHLVRDSQGKAIEILSVGTDITEQKRAHEALRRSEEQFRLIMENLADLVAVLDLDGNRLYNSPSYQSILGAPENLFGTSSFAQVHPDDQARVRQTFLETVRAGIGQRLEYRLVDLKGRTRSIESQGSVIRDAKGRVAQVVVVSRDVTERRAAEQEIRELNANLERRVAERTRELEAALVRAEAADRLKSAFLATMSHELRTPLNSIIGFTGIILQGLAGPINSEQNKQLGMVRTSARHLLELINDVLDLSKIEAGQLEVRAEPFSLPESLERVIASVRPLAQKKDLALSLHLRAQVGVMVSDRRRFEQIALNLVNNAIKFTERGQVTVAVEKVDHFKLSSESAPLEAIRLSVSDTGCGIRTEDLDDLFLPFHQLDTGLARQHEGTGLGLAICRRLAALLGGEIIARSEWTKGSEFIVTLPLHRELPQ